MRMDKYLKRLVCISANFELKIFAYTCMNIFEMLTMILCRRNEEKIFQKFVLLEVASDKKFGQHFL